MRLVTRSDFDGLACAVLLTELGIIDDYLFAHPKDLQDNKIAIGANDVLTNVPYVPGCGLWFDHHASEIERVAREGVSYPGLLKAAPSCARVIWDYYGEERFPARLKPMLEAADKVDSADLRMEDILEPKGWVLLGFLMDPRTGLGRFRDFRISNYQLMMDMIEYCRSKSDEEILAVSDVRERVEHYLEQQDRFRDMLARTTTPHSRLAVTDLRGEQTIYVGNRFTIYAMYPECNLSMQVMWGKDRQNVVFTVGHSILNKTAKVNVGRLMLQFGGGGHHAVGTCQAGLDEAETVKRKLIDRLAATE